MNIARILYPVKVLGPGSRVGIWTCGCPRRCKGCSNPELWEQQPFYEIKVTDLLQLLTTIFKQKQVDGFTITGGDPFYQASELAKLLQGLSPLTKDILVYTGFTYDELLGQKLQEEAQHSDQKRRDRQACLRYIGVLVDGPYLENENDGSFLRGSSNQKIFILQKELKPLYTEYLAQGKNEIQNFMTTDGLISVGIHETGFTDELRMRSKEKGVLIHG